MIGCWLRFFDLFRYKKDCQISTSICRRLFLLVCVFLRYKHGHKKFDAEGCYPSGAQEEGGQENVMNVFGTVVQDYGRFGQLVERWVTHREKLPHSRSELEQVAHGALILPDGIKEIAFVQSQADRLTIRLPARDRFFHFLEAAQSNMYSEYPLPYFYRAIEEG